jgi:hypothetical protein
MPISTERRLKRRFPIQREVRYRILESSRPESGAGVAINASSGGIAFTCDRQLPVNASIEISLSWPVALQNSCPLRLVAKGRVVRSDGTSAACTIEKSEFRTQARSSLDDLRQVFTSAVCQQAHVYA